jgi:DNA mismatch endonuclease (patch repair protein)
MDSMSAQQRSQLMGRIRGKDTKPELIVRRLLHAAGYRYRLHGRLPPGTLERLRREHPQARLPGGKLPGTPDIVFSARHQAVFINGCFWHLHDCPAGQHAPATNAEFWAAKRNRTRERDHQNVEALRELGWETIVLWECELRDKGATLETLAGFLGPPSSSEQADGF